MPEQQRTVVVVEDDDGMRRAIERLLRGAGLRPMLFDSAEALLETGLPPGTGCVVLDIRLPGLSGLELIRKLAESGAKLPCIFVTAYDDPRDRAESERLGAIAYLPKPFHGRVLLKAITTALGAG